MTYLQTLIRFYNPNFQLIEGKNTYSVISPVPHDNKIEEHPSSTYFVDTNILYDFFYQKKYTELDLAVFYENIDGGSANIYLKLFNQNFIQYQRKNDLDSVHLHNVYKYFDPKILENLQISLTAKGEMIVPVVYYSRVIDLRIYRPNNNTIKVFSGVKHHTPTGLIIPYDIARFQNKKTTVVCEGEKDMIMARSVGLEAICITGGAMRLPEFNTSFIKGRNFFICYDNDNTGRRGSERLGNYLLEKKAKQVKILDWTKITHFTPQNKADLFDFFTLYNQTKTDLTEIYKKTPIFRQTKSKIDIQKELLVRSSLKTINEAKKIYNTLGKTLSSRVQIISSWDEILAVPATFHAKNSDARHHINFTNIEDNLLLLGNKNQQERAMANLLGVKDDIEIEGKLNTIYRYDIFDFETETPETAVLYSVNKSLKAGRKYNIEYKVVTHPLENNQVVFVLLNATDIDSEINEFFIKEKEKKVLTEAFSVKPKETVERKMLQYYHSAKDYVGNYLCQDIYFATELLFHSVLEINYNNENIRGALDILMIGATRIGKSECARKLIDLYKRGAILSLKNSTENGLIGGSTKAGTKKGWKLTIGELTRQHKGLLVMEELQGCSFDAHRALTDLRSSGEVRLVRVSGTMRVPTINRRLTLSNPLSETLDIRQYSNGMRIVQELVKKPEDIARYDLVCIPEPIEQMVKPKKKKNTPQFDASLYVKKMQWVWSRKAKHVTIKDIKTLDTLWTETIRLNNKFETSSQLLGRETNLKLLRLSCAVATMVFSTDDDIEKVIVLPEHVKWASNFIDKLYSNSIFRLHEYVLKNKRYLETNKEDFNYISNFCDEAECHREILEAIANHENIYLSKNYLTSLVNLAPEVITPILNNFVKRYYLKLYKNNEYIITKRFRILLEQFKESVDDGIDWE